MLACLRIGAPYVFLDPKNPLERCARIIERIRPSILFSESGTPNSHGQSLRLSKEDGTGLLDGENSDAAEIASPALAANSISADYFETVGIRLLAGRGFLATDDSAAEAVAIPNASLARYLFGDDNPIDRRFQQQQFNGQWGPWIRVVGVAADTREYGLAEGATHTLYRPAAQVFPGQSLVIRTAGDIATVIQHVRASVRELDADRPLDRVATLENLRVEDLAPSRLNATLFSAFALLALVIASVGVLGVLGFSVSQRTREFGVRMALGARKGQVLAMVLGEGGRMLVAALVLGAAASLLLARFLTGILFQVRSADPATYATVTLVLSGVALLAAYLPARRATRVQPMEALPALVAEQGLAIGVIATPAASAQDVCNQLVSAGVSSILNFAPCVLVVPEGVDVRKVDLSTELQILAFHEQRKALAGDGARSLAKAVAKAVAQ